MAFEAQVTRTLTVSNAMGLHARPAAQLVHIANRFKAEVRLRRPGGRNSEADCRSVLAMLMLAACKDTVLEVMASGEDAEAAVAAVSDYFERSFDEV